MTSFRHDMISRLDMIYIHTHTIWLRLESFRLMLLWLKTSTTIGPSIPQMPCLPQTPKELKLLLAMVWHETVYRKDWMDGCWMLLVNLYRWKQQKVTMINIFQIQGLNAWPVPRTVKFLFYMAKIAQIFTSSAGARKHHSPTHRPLTCQVP